MAVILHPKMVYVITDRTGLDSSYVAQQHVIIIVSQ